MNSNPTILYVLAQGKGGIPHYTAELANAVAEHTDVHVMKPVQSTADDLFSDNITMHNSFDVLNISLPDIVKNNVNPVRVLQGMYSYRRMRSIYDINPDIVHFTMEAELFPHVKFLAKRLQIDSNYPVVETFHDVWPRHLLRRGRDLAPNASLKNVFLYNLLVTINRPIPELKRAHTIVHTKEHKRRLQQRNTPVDRISVIPHGAFQVFRELSSDEQTEENTLLFFGNISPDKSPESVIKAIPAIRESIPDVTLLVAGDGTLSKESRQIIDQYSDHFEVRNEFIPNEDVGTLFSRAELVVIPHQRQHGHSGTLTIAYSFGKPVVTTNIGEFRELVRDTGSGLVVPPNDPQSLADAIIAILVNDQLRNSMAENAAEMSERLSWEGIAQRHLDIYNDIV